MSALKQIHEDARRSLLSDGLQIRLISQGRARKVAKPDDLSTKAVDLQLELSMIRAGITDSQLINRARRLSDKRKLLLINKLNSIPVNNDVGAYGAFVRETLGNRGLDPQLITNEIAQYALTNTRSPLISAQIIADAELANEITLEQETVLVPTPLATPLPTPAATPAATYTGPTVPTAPSPGPSILSLPIPPHIQTPVIPPGQLTIGNLPALQSSSSSNVVSGIIPGLTVPRISQPTMQFVPVGSSQGLSQEQAAAMPRLPIVRPRPPTTPRPADQPRKELKGKEPAPESTQQSESPGFFRSFTSLLGKKRS